RPPPLERHHPENDGMASRAARTHRRPRRRPLLQRKRSSAEPDGCDLGCQLVTLGKLPVGVTPKGSCRLTRSTVRDGEPHTPTVLSKSPVRRDPGLRRRCRARYSSGFSFGIPSASPPSGLACGFSDPSSGLSPASFTSGFG